MFGLPLLPISSLLLIDPPPVTILPHFIFLFSHVPCYVISLTSPFSVTSLNTSLTLILFSAILTLRLRLRLSLPLGVTFSNTLAHQDSPPSYTKDTRRTHPAHVAPLKVLDLNTSPIAATS